MPRLINPPTGPALDLAEVAARLDESGVDLSDEASIAQCADLLAGLGRDRDFLADRVIAALAASYADQLEINRYSAPVSSEEHTSELPSLMRISYAVLCVK